MLNSIEAFVSAFESIKKPIAFLVGSPLSLDKNGAGVPGVYGVLEIVREVVQTEAAAKMSLFEEAIQGKSGSEAYQTAMAWLQAYIHQDAVNMVVRRAVMKSCLQVSTVGDLVNPSSDGEPMHWHLPAGTKDLGTLLCSNTDHQYGPVLTPNFDPLISHSVRVAGGRPNIKVLDTDGGYSGPRFQDNSLR